jgi:hypothetical protein
MHQLDICGFGSWPQSLPVKISYDSLSLLFVLILTLQVFNVRGILWVAVGNVIFHSALIVAAGEYFSQAF